MLDGTPDNRPEPAPLRDVDVEERIRALISDPAGLGAPGFAVGVFRQGHVTGLVTTGAADVAARRPINGDTQFYAASTSKQFTALALIQLVLAGKVALADDIRAYLPELPEAGEPVSVAMLLHHTGGIRDSFSMLAVAGYPQLALPARAEALHTLLRQPHTNIRPGTKFDYTNGGYLLLSEVVERVADEPFAAYVDRMVLRPLGMTRSFMLAGRRSDDPNVASGYTVREGQLTLADDYPLYGGSGGLMTTLNDLARYDHDIDTGRKVWTPSLTALMLEPGRYGDGRLASFGRWRQVYASGVVVGPHWFSHAGSVVGFKCNYARLASRRIGLAILCNRGDANTGEILNGVAAALREELPPVAEVAGGVFGGLYESEDLDVIYDIDKVGRDDLTIRVLPGHGKPPRQTIGLSRVGDGSYIGAGLRLIPDEGGDGLRIESGRLSIVFSRA